MHKHSRVQLDFDFPFAGKQLMLLKRYDKVAHTVNPLLLTTPLVESTLFSCKHIILNHLVTIIS